MKKFLYSILAFGAVALMAAGCSKDDGIDNNGDGPEPEGPKTPYIEVYQAVYTDGVWDGETWSNDLAEGNLRFVWNASEMVYEQTMKVVAYNYTEEVKFDVPEWMDCTAVECEEEYTYVYDLQVTLEKLQENTAEDGLKYQLVFYESDGETWMSQVMAIVGVVPFLPAQPSLRGEAGTWTAEVDVYVGDAQNIMVAMIPVGTTTDNFVRQAQNTMANIVGADLSKKPYFMYTSRANWATEPGAMLLADARRTDDNDLITVDVQHMSNTIERLSPDTEYRAVVFATYAEDYRTEPGVKEMKVTVGSATVSFYYLLTESATFKTAAFLPNNDASIVTENVTTNHNRAKMKIQFPTEYEMVVYGTSDVKPEGGKYNSVPNAVMELNDGTEHELYQRFTSNEARAYLFAYGIKPDGTIAGIEIDEGKGEADFESEATFDTVSAIGAIPLTIKDGTFYKHTDANGVVTIDLSLGANYTHVDSTPAAPVELSVGISEFRYVRYDSAPSIEQIKADLTTPSENCVKSTSTQFDIQLVYTPNGGTYELEPLGYWYAMLVDSEGEYSRIASIGEVVTKYETAEEETDNPILVEHLSVDMHFETALEFFGQPFYIDYKYFENAETSEKADTSVWKQTIKSGSKDAWLVMPTLSSPAIVFYSGELASTAVDPDAKEVWLVHMRNTGVKMSETNLGSIINSLTNMFQHYPEIPLDIYHSESTLDPGDGNGTAYYAKGTPGNVKLPLNIQFDDEGRYVYANCDTLFGGEGSALFTIVVDKNDNLTLKAVGWIEDGSQEATVIDLTNYKF